MHLPGSCDHRIDRVCRCLLCPLGCKMSPEGVDAGASGYDLWRIFRAGCPSGCLPTTTRNALRTFASQRDAMHLPGIYYNNRNRPHILRSFAGMVLSGNGVEPTGRRGAVGFAAGRWSGVPVICCCWSCFWAAWLQRWQCPAAVMSCGRAASHGAVRRKFSRRRFWAGRY